MSRFIDHTEQMPQAPRPTPTRTTLVEQDWASLVAAAEGPAAVYVADYDFSGRTFERRDVLLNPRAESAPPPAPEAPPEDPPEPEVIPLTLVSVSPTTGGEAGGQAVTITGTSFAAGITVTFGGSTAGSIVIVSATEITCTSPAGTIGAVDVVVTLGDQTDTLAGGYSYTAATMAEVTASLGATLYWPMSEPSGSIIDLQSAVSADPTGTIAYEYDLGTTAPGGVDLAGAGHFATASDLTITETTFTLFFVMRTSADFSVLRRLFHFGDLGTPATEAGWFIGCSTAGRLQLETYSGTWRSAVAVSTLSTSTIYSVAVVVVPGGPILFYRDGVLTDTIAFSYTVNVPATIRSMRFGGRRPTIAGEQWLGVLGHWAYFPSALTGAQILSLHTATGL